MDSNGGDFGDAVMPAFAPDVVRALEHLTRAADLLHSSLSDARVRDAVDDLRRRMSGVEAGWLRFVRDLDGRPNAIPGTRPGEGARAFLVNRLRASPGQAGPDVRAARTLDPDAGDLPLPGEALRGGDVSREHVDVCVSVATDLPAKTKPRSCPPA